MLEVKSKKKMSKKRSFLLKGGLFFLIALIFFSSPLKKPKGESSFFSLLQGVIYPFQYGFELSRIFVLDSFNRYVYLLAVSDENEKLKNENFLLRAELLGKNNLKAELKRLKKLLNFSEKISTEKMMATRVVSNFHHLSTHGIRVSSGTNSGVQVGMPVVSPKGVVGKVVRTSPFYSDVSLVSDSQFVLDIFVERTRVRTILKGDYHDSCIFDLPKNYDLKVGDTVVTSGLLGIFTKGLPVGVVSDIDMESSDLVKVARVKLWSKLDSLEEVLILKQKSLDPFEQQEVASFSEKGGDE